MNQPLDHALAAVDEAFRAQVMAIANVLHNAVVTTDEASAAIDRARTGYRMALSVRQTMERIVREEK